jgi:hypothetical protein
MEMPARSSTGLSCGYERAGRVADRARIWVGVDVGKAAHHVCAVDETGEVVFSQRLINSQAAIEQAIIRASEAADDVRWAVGGGHDLRGGGAAGGIAGGHRAASRVRDGADGQPHGRRLWRREQERRQRT